MMIGLHNIYWYNRTHLHVFDRCYMGRVPDWYVRVSGWGLGNLLKDNRAKPAAYMVDASGYSYQMHY